MKSYGLAVSFHLIKLRRKETPVGMHCPFLIIFNEKSILMHQRQTEVLTLKQATALSRSMNCASIVVSYRLCEANFECWHVTNGRAVSPLNMTNSLRSDGGKGLWSHFLLLPSDTHTASAWGCQNCWTVCNQLCSESNPRSFLRHS